MAEPWKVPKKMVFCCFCPIFFFLTVLGFELRASHLLSRPLPFEHTPSSLFALVVFQVGSHVFLPRAGLGL
jgi:hypothetical protein